MMEEALKKEPSNVITFPKLNKRVFVKEKSPEEIEEKIIKNKIRNF